MLGNKNKKTKTAMGGIGIAVLLCALMAFMPMTSLVDNTATDTVSNAEIVSEVDDFFKLPATIEQTTYEYDAAQELLGMRQMNTKGFLTEDGKIAQLTSDEPMHYLADSGAYEDINLNIMATPEGWEVTENIFTTSFGAEVASGVSIQPNQFVDPIVTGLNPMLVTIDITGTAPMPYHAAPATGDVEVGGNVIRYPLADGFALDYSVDTTQVKQNLLIQERPVLDEIAAYFGMTETIRLPMGYGLYLDGVALGEEITTTQGELEIRNVESGELLATIPEPVVMEESATEPYYGTYFVQVHGPMVLLTTAVESDWLMSEDRAYPLALDPTIKVTSGSRGYCYVYYGYCYDNTYSYLYRYYGSYYYVPWHRYAFTSSSALPSGATVEEVNWKQYVNYGYGSSSGTAITARVLEACGTDVRYDYGITSASCSGAIGANLLSGSNSNTNERKLISSIGNSAAAGTYSQGTGWKTAEICDNNNAAGTACSSSTGSHNYILNAQTNSGTVGMGADMTSAIYIYTRAYNSGGSNSYLEVVYSGGSDTDAPTSSHVAYSGLTSYVEGQRTFFTKLTDLSGIDTTSTNGVKLFYSINNGTWTSVSATTVQSCGTSSTDCRFKASTPDLSAGDYVEYYWKFQDLNSGSNGANVGYDPVPPASASNPATWVQSNANYFFVDDVANAGTAKKMTVLQTDVHSGSYYSPQGYHDRQMTYYDHSDEYLFEWDVSNCGTGSYSCFYSSSYYFYNQWKLQWTTAPSSGYNGFGGTQSGLNELHQGDGGFLAISAKNGPQMNLIYHYDATANDWGMVGVGDSTPEIETGKLAGGTGATSVSTYGYTAAYNIPLSGLDITGTFGKFDWNGTYSTSKANWLCAGTNGFYYFYRSTSSNARCSSGYYYAYQTSSYKWSGFALSAGYYGRMASSGSTTYKVGNVAPTPDTSAPTMDHGTMRDSHSKSRTFTYTIADAGDPPSGLNVNQTIGEGPTLYYSINNGTQNSVLLSPVGKQRSACIDSECDWSAELTTLERGDYVTYYATSVDSSTASSGINTKTTASNSFEVGDPNMMLIVEWRDMGYNTQYLCDYQVIFYDVTNEIEFKYDSSCSAYYDYATVGYMDHTRTKGDTMRNPGAGYMAGNNPHSSNFRISTDGNDHGYESFSTGIKPVTNAAQVISGTSNGQPTGYYCSYSYYWNQYKTGCNANIDLPSGFQFDYFQKSFDGDDSNDRLRIGRAGYLYMIDSGSTALERGITTWGTNMPSLPYSSNSAARPGTIAPWWGYYSSYYCYDNSNTDCGVYVRAMPFEGKGTDIDSDLDCSSNNVECIWDNEGSPYRISPNGDFLSVSGGDLTIEPGTVIQVESGKGISVDGACDSVKANGNSSDHILFEGQNGAEWKGLSFTDDCATTGGTDNRHVFSYVDFNNTSTAAISAGSRHGDYNAYCADSNGGTRPCYSNSNVGNFTLSHVTFTNVETAIRHGSGQGTGFSMNDFSINGADKACINLPSSSDAMIKEGTMTNCNTDGETWGGAIVNYPGSTGGMLHVENVTIENAYVNLFDTDLQHVTVSNVTATITSGTAQTGSVLSSDFGVASEVKLFNFVADDYASASINALGHINMTEVDWGDADLTIAPGGASSTANGPSGDHAIMDDVTAGDMLIYRMQPSIFADVTAGHIDFSGNAISTDAMVVTNLDSGRFGVAGCGWIIDVTTVDSDRVYSSCSSSAAPNMMIFDGGTLTHTSSTDHAVYARNSKMTLGNIAITSSNAGSGVYLAYGSSNADIRLIEVDQNGDDCADSSGSTGDCDVYTSGSAVVYYGGFAELRAYRLEAVNGVVEEVNKTGHVVSASVVNGAGSELFEVGSHITNADGEADVWVITGDSNGNTYSDHNLRAFGPAGQNETLASDAWYISDLSSGFTIGSSYALLLEPSPVDFNGTNMDCSWLAAWTDADTGAGLPTNGTTASGQPIYEFDGTPMTLTEDLNLNGCVIKLMGAVLKVKSTATSTPVLTLSNGGKLLVGKSSVATGALQAVSSTYPLHIDIQDGVLEVDGGIVRDVAQDATTGAALYVGDGATLIMKNSGTVYGSSASSDEMATVKIDGGSANIDSSSIINVGNTGTALWVEQSSGSYTNVAVSNAAVGIQSYNGAPQIDGFTSTDNTVGVDVYGGMSLPTIYRSTSLSGQSTGWHTYAIDLSAFLGSGDYLQVGANSIYGGGNAHPTYNYASSKYYMLTDRWNIEITYDDGSGEVSENITTPDKMGYYPWGSNDPKSGNGAATYAGGEGGVASWHCNDYGYSYGPGYSGSFDGWMYYIWRYWSQGPQQFVSYPGYYYYPDQFGFRWSEIDEDTSPSYGSYPYHYWGYYYNSYHGGQSTYKPPEGYVGYGGYYNICLDYAYSYYNSPGEGARMSFPIVDISDSSISAVTMYVDVLHNRADNYQDRLDFVARAGSDPSDLGDYARDSGTASFQNGAITGADTGVQIGGNFASGAFDGIDITSPTDSGIEIVGATSAAMNDVEVDGGDYGMLVSSSGSGQMDLTNIDFDGQNNAGVYYVKDFGGELTGTISNSAGAAYQYGAQTNKDASFDGVTVAGNNIGIETAGSGDITISDSTFANTLNDVKVTGSSEIDFIEGTIDTTKVAVTGNGGFERMREITMTLEADGNPVDDTNVVLMNSEKKITGTGTTDSNGEADGILFRTIRVDSSGLSNDDLAGYEAVTVAEIDYTSTKGDFRYAFESLSLNDAAGNTGTIDLTDRINARVCYSFSSASYEMVARCAGSLSTGGSRDLSDGDGGTYKEYGYYGATPGDMSGKTIMMDIPFFFFDDNDEHNWNNTLVLVTGSYTFSDTQRWYGASGSNAPELYLHGSEVYGIGTNSNTGQQTGLELGWIYDAMDISIKDTTLNPVATITSGMDYNSNWNNYDYKSEFFQMENVTVTHYKGYTPLSNAIQSTDVCVQLTGTDGSYIKDSTFNDCGTAIYMSRSPYAYTHSNSEFGADNLTIEGNEFLDGGEIGDVWVGSNAYVDDLVVTGNWFNSTSSEEGVQAYSGNNKRIDVTDNYFNGPQTAIQMLGIQDYTLDNNDITGTAEAGEAGIEVDGGYGVVSNNSLLDADGGIYMEDATSPPAPSTSLCTIASNSYSSTTSCTFTVPSGATAYVDLESDSWGGEIGLEITKPDGTKDTWAAGSFSSNTIYARLTSYTTSGSYTLKVTDTWGDGGANIAVYYGTSAGGYDGPSVENNTVAISAGRTAPNAVGLDLNDCDKVSVMSKDNTITIGDNAMVIDGCDVNDVDSTFVGTGASSSIGISSLNSGDDLDLDGTSVAGYDYGISIEDATLLLHGDASIAGATAGVYADSATVTAIGASVDGGTTGTGLYMVDGDYSWIYPLDAAGNVGVYAENTEFRWDGGTSTATTALHAVESVGSVENLTWSASTTQINAGSNAYVTSIGNTLDSNAISIVASATIDEANLFSLDATHLQGTASAVGMTLVSTDGTRAAYVSPSFQPDIMAVDGDNSDWVGNTPLNPSDDAMPGMVSGDGTNDFYVTYSEGDALYIGMTGEDLTSNDLLIYLDVVAGGSNTGYNLNGAHTLPVQADYLFWATSDSNMDLYSNGFLGWGASSLSTDAVDADLGTTTAGFFEIAIPFSRIGGTPDAVNIVAVVQDGSANIQTIHPTQTVTTGVQTLSEYISIETTHEDLETGSITDEVLVYRTYKGTTTAGPAKDYDVMIKTKADCAYDWATVDAVSMATNQELTVDIKRACPEIQSTLADDAVDEDSGAYSFSLTNLADDVQDDEATLTWSVTEGTTVAHSNVLVDWDKNGHTVTITPLDDQFGTVEFEFIVTDSHGLTDTKNMTLTVNNINDKPVICNTERADCMPVFVDDGSYTNIVPEGFGSVSKFLGDISNASKSYIRDMDNEQSPVRQVYTWDASVPTECIAFGVSVTANELTITENTDNELGGTCTVTLSLTDDGAENQDADAFTVDFSVSPVNDAPVVLDWDVTSGAVVTAANGSTPVAPWSISLMEDDTNTNNLTYDLSAVKYDVDHNAADLTWTVESTDQCTYENYFSTEIVGDNLVFTLVPDATTTANAWEIDYLNDNGIHQIGPSGSDFCQIRLVLKDTATAPSYVPNYDQSVMPIANYQQGVATQEIGVRVENVRELVADYYFDDVVGFDFLGINNVLTGTYVPVEVNVGAGGDQGPYTYDHMLAVTFHTSGGHGEAENVMYITPPEWGQTMTITEYVYVVDDGEDTPYIWVEMDVLTCLDAECDMSKSPAQRFQTDDPTSHINYGGGVVGDQWSKPGAYGDDGQKESQRRPLLQDSDWCNNVMFSDSSAIGSDAGIPTTCNHANKPSEDFLSSGDKLPSVVQLGGGIGSVPSFAPSLVVVALAGFFVTALAMSSRREEDEEEEETRRIVEDEMAVSPVIATILMVAITVVLSGVIYVWASSLAETGKLGVPRVTFDIENEKLGTADGYWSITVDQTEAELATAAVTVTVLYTDLDTGARTSYATLLSNTSNVYGFNPSNSDAFVTFVDKVEDQGSFKESTFGIGDQIFVRTHAPDGQSLTDATIRITYQPGPGEGSVIKTYSDLAFNKNV
jgi:FlaG/FlaF family flagellin (archaellin)